MQFNHVDVKSTVTFVFRGIKLIAALLCAAVGLGAQDSFTS